MGCPLLGSLVLASHATTHLVYDHLDTPRKDPRAFLRLGASTESLSLLRGDVNIDARACTALRTVEVSCVHAGHDRLPGFQKQDILFPQGAVFELRTGCDQQKVWTRTG